MHRLVNTSPDITFTSYIIKKANPSDAKQNRCMRCKQETPLVRWLYKLQAITIHILHKL